jgi:hypothetical protein
MSKILIDRAVVEQALEFCESVHGGCTDSDDGTVEAITVWCPELIDALRAELAEPVLNPAPGYCKHCKQYTIEEPLPAEPVQEPVALKWLPAPRKTEWGFGMVSADVEIDRDHTLTLYCEDDQTAKVDAMFRRVFCKEDA